MQQLVSDTLADGYPAAQVAAQMLDYLVGEGPIARAMSSAAKAKIAVQLAEVDKQLIDGADEYMQLCNLLAFTMRMMRT
jgi:replication factor C subunit 2/4